MRDRALDLRYYQRFLDLLGFKGPCETQQLVQAAHDVRTVRWFLRSATQSGVNLLTRISHSVADAHAHRCNPTFLHIPRRNAIPFQSQSCLSTLLFQYSGSRSQTFSMVVKRWGVNLSAFAEEEIWKGCGVVMGWDAAIYCNPSAAHWPPSYAAVDDASGNGAQSCSSRLSEHKVHAVDNMMKQILSNDSMLPKKDSRQTQLCTVKRQRELLWSISDG